MAQVTHRTGAPEVVDYTPTGGAVSAGDVVMLGNLTGITCGVAQVDIPNNTKGSLAIGGGQYEGINLNNAANYAKVYWDYSVDKFTTVSTNMSTFGYVGSGGGGGANTLCQVVHQPKV